MWKRQGKTSYSDTFNGGFVAGTGGCVGPMASRKYILSLDSDSIVIGNLYTVNLETLPGAMNAQAYSCIAVDGTICGSTVNVPAPGTPGTGHSAGTSATCITSLEKGTHTFEFQGYMNGLTVYSGTVTVWPL